MTILKIPDMIRIETTISRRSENNADSLHH